MAAGPYKRCNSLPLPASTPSGHTRCPSHCHAPAGYIGEFEFVDNHRSGKIVVELNGR